MRKLLRWIGRVGLALVGLVAGCWWGGGVGMYGVVPAYGVPEPPHDPTVSLEDFSYTPESPVRLGDRMVFTVRANKPTAAGSVSVKISGPGSAWAGLNDSGITPDDIPGDGTWAGEWKMPELNEPGNYDVLARLDWFDGFKPLEIDGEPLEILPDEDAK